MNVTGRKQGLKPFLIEDVDWTQESENICFISVNQTFKQFLFNDDLEFAFISWLDIVISGLGWTSILRLCLSVRFFAWVKKNNCNRKKQNYVLCLEEVLISYLFICVCVKGELGYSGCYLSYQLLYSIQEFKTTRGTESRGLTGTALFFPPPWSQAIVRKSNILVLLLLFTTLGARLVSWGCFKLLTGWFTIGWDQ